MAETITDSKKLLAKFERNQKEILKLNKEIEAMVGERVTKMASLEAKQVEMKDAIYQAMTENDIDKFDGDLISITRVKATTVTTFDSKKFAEERPQVYKKYLKTGDKKGYIKIKVKA